MVATRPFGLDRDLCAPGANLRACGPSLTALGKYCDKVGIKKLTVEPRLSRRSDKNESTSVPPLSDVIRLRRALPSPVDR